MLDLIRDEVLLAHLKTVPAFSAVNGYTSQDGADHKRPALTVRAHVGTTRGFRHGIPCDHANMIIGTEKVLLVMDKVLEHLDRNRLS